MNQSFWEILASTPWWVYVLFIYLLRVGYYATKPRYIHVYSLLILPTIFLLLTFTNMYTTMLFNLLHLGVWLGAGLLGALAGWLQFSFYKMKAVKDKKLLYMPGSWSLLVLILMIFAVKYYFGYLTAVSPDIFLDPKFSLWVLFFYGLFTGIFVGRLAYAFRRLKTGPFITPDANKTK